MLNIVNIVVLSFLQLKIFAPFVKSKMIRYGGDGGKHVDFVRLIFRQQNLTGCIRQTMAILLQVILQKSNRKSYASNIVTVLVLAI